MILKNYIEKEKQERKAKLTESIKSLKEQRKRKEQEYKRLNEYSVGFARKCQKLELEKKIKHKVR